MIPLSLCTDKQGTLRAVRPVLALVVSAALVALASPAVRAHAIVVAATPAVNAIVASGDTAIRLEFNSRIDHARSRLALHAPDGAVRVLPLAQSAPNVLEGRAEVLEPGAWMVQWQVLSQDGHITRGDVPFTVRAR